MPISTARKRVLGASNLAKQRSVGTIWVKVAEGYDMKAAEEQVRALLRQRHRLQAGQDDDFSLRNLEEVAATQEASGRVLALLLAAVASVSLVVGGIGIMNIMLVSVTERTREIGLRMAVGARTRDILGQFLVEAVTLSLIGGVAGIAIGIGDRGGHRGNRRLAHRAVARIGGPRGRPSPSRSACSSASIRRARPPASIRSRRCASNER